MLCYVVLCAEQTRTLRYFRFAKILELHGCSFVHEILLDWTPLVSFAAVFRDVTQRSPAAWHLERRLWRRLEHHRQPSIHYTRASIIYWQFCQTKCRWVDWYCRKKHPGLVLNEVGAKETRVCCSMEWTQSEEEVYAKTTETGTPKALILGSCSKHNKKSRCRCGTHFSAFPWRIFFAKQEREKERKQKKLEVSTTMRTHNGKSFVWLQNRSDEDLVQ